MMKRLWFFTIIALFAAIFDAEAKKPSDNQLVYEIEGAGTAQQGYYMVKVTLVTSDKKASDDLLKKAAVHGVLFKGFSSTEHRQSQRPLAGGLAAEAEHADFYKDFFGENGTAASYATVISGTRTLAKVGKEYRISENIMVNKEALLRHLSDAGVVRTLNSAF